MQDPQTEAVRDQCVCTQEAQFGPIYNMLRDQPRFACACTLFDICGAVMIWFVTPTPVLAKRLLRIVTVTSATFGFETDARHKIKRVDITHQIKKT